MTNETSKPSDTANTVVSCIKESNYSTAVVDYAVWISKTANAPLKFLHTLATQTTPAVDLSGAIGLGASADLLEELTEAEEARNKLQIKKGNLMLQGAKERAVSGGIENPILCQQHGSLADGLIELEDRIRVVVAGIRGDVETEEPCGISPQLQTVIRSINKPILIVNQKFSEPKEIMLAYDGNDAAKKALSMVASSPLFKSCKCHLVHVSNNPSDEHELLEHASKHLSDSGIETVPVLLTGKIDEQLSLYQAEKDIDLMLMGAFSHSRIHNFLLGSFTERMLAKTRKPVLLLR